LRANFFPHCAAFKEKQALLLKPASVNVLLNGASTLLLIIPTTHLLPIVIRMSGWFGMHLLPGSERKLHQPFANHQIG